MNSIKQLLAVLAIPLGAATVAAAPIEIILTPDPSSNPAAAALGKYMPGEVVHVRSILRSIDATVAPDIGIVQFDYSNSGPGIIAYDSDSCTSAFCNLLPLEVNPPASPIFARVTPTIPSTAVITSQGVAFVRFDAIASPVPNGMVIVDVLGPNTPGDATGAYITTSNFSITWDNGLPGAQPILGGTVALMTIPEPGSVSLLMAGLVCPLVFWRFRLSARG